MTLTILHIEDEYNEFEGIVSDMAVMFEDYCEEKHEKLEMAVTSVIGTGEGKPPSWIAYELSTTLQPDHKIRYIFVKDADVPEDVEQFIVGEKYFIVDVLRPEKKGGMKLKEYHETSLKAINPFVDDQENVVLFTAHQGNGLETSFGKLPRKISKEKPNELQEFLCGALLKYLPS